jgi:hypothetical protein
MERARFTQPRGRRGWAPTPLPLFRAFVGLATTHRNIGPSFWTVVWPIFENSSSREGRRGRREKGGTEDEEEWGQCRRHCRSSAPRSSCSSCCAAHRWPMGGSYGSMRLLRSLRLSSTNAASPPQRLRHLLPRVGWIVVVACIFMGFSVSSYSCSDVSGLLILA